MDRYQLSIPVAKQLLEKNISITGTLKANRKALPPAMEKTKDRDKIADPLAKVKACS